MESGTVLTKLADVLHAIAQGLLVPDIILLLGFIGYALFSIGSIVMEAIKEHRNYQVETPKFLAALMGASDSELPSIIKNSGLLNRQKQALLTVYDYRTLPGDALVALIRKLVNNEENHYSRITARNNTAAKIAPMAGLMGTLIPLGPGVAALGTGETATLSSSLLIAFDTTVAGLIVALICLAIGKIRSIWYNDYMAMLDAGMATMLQKIETMREKGQITEKEPTNYAFLFEQGLKKDADKSKVGKFAAGKTSSTSTTAGGAAGTTGAAGTSTTGASATAGTTGGTGTTGAVTSSGMPITPSMNTRTGAAGSSATGTQSASPSITPASPAGTALQTQPTKTTAIGQPMAQPGCPAATGVRPATQPGQQTPAQTARPVTTPQTGAANTARPGATTPGAGATRPLNMGGTGTSTTPTGTTPSATQPTTPAAGTGATTPQNSNTAYINQLAAKAQAEARAQTQPGASTTTPSTSSESANRFGKHSNGDTPSKWPFSKK